MKLIFIDGYNVINSWSNLKDEKEVSLDSARLRLIDILHNYGAINKCKITIVFDGHKVAGNLESKYEHNKNLSVVFTKDGVTADAYIEKAVHNVGRKYEVCVVTSDSLEQQTIFQRGAIRISSLEFYNDVFKAEKDTQKDVNENNRANRSSLKDNVKKDIWEKLEAMRRG